jgi:dethiobiotin synthetase
MKMLFITGTDTDIGKTYCALTLMRLFNEKGYKTFGMKPIASGCFLNSHGYLVSEDALALQKMATIKRSYHSVNPFSFEQPIAPHIAAKKIGRQLSVTSVVEKIEQSLQSSADINIIEGVGGWSVPLNDHEILADVVQFFNMPTILVVGIKLGCINHSIQTSQSIVNRQVPYVGWIANGIDNTMLERDENIKSLERWIPVPCLGVLPFGVPNDDHENSINVELILERAFG